MLKRIDLRLYNQLNLMRIGGINLWTHVKADIISEAWQGRRIHRAKIVHWIFDAIDRGETTGFIQIGILKLPKMNSQFPVVLILNFHKLSFELNLRFSLVSKADRCCRANDQDKSK